MHEMLVSLLEFFEIIYKMRMDLGVVSFLGTRLHEEQMFFVPSLLWAFSGGMHPSLQHWKLIKPMYVLLFSHMCSIF